MGGCYSGDHNAETHIHTDITTGNIEESQQKHRLVGTVSNRLLEGLSTFYWIQTLPYPSLIQYKKQTGS